MYKIKGGTTINILIVWRHTTLTPLSQTVTLRLTPPPPGAWCHIWTAPNLALLHLVEYRVIKITRKFVDFILYLPDLHRIIPCFLLVGRSKFNVWKKTNSSITDDKVWLLFEKMCMHNAMGMKANANLSGQMFMLSNRLIYTTSNMQQNSTWTVPKHQEKFRSSDITGENNLDRIVKKKWNHYKNDKK